MQEINKTILGLTIERRRLMADMSRAELAMAVGVTPAAVWQYEKGATIPTPQVIVRLAQVFDCSTDELLGLSRGEVPSA